MWIFLLYVIHCDHLIWNLPIWSIYFFLWFPLWTFMGFYGEVAFHPLCCPLWIARLETAHFFMFRFYFVGFLFSFHPFKYFYRRPAVFQIRVKTLEVRLFYPHDSHVIQEKFINILVFNFPRIVIPCKQREKSFRSVILATNFSTLYCMADIFFIVLQTFYWRSSSPKTLY